MLHEHSFQFDNSSGFSVGVTDYRSETDGRAARCDADHEFPPSNPRIARFCRLGPDDPWRVHRRALGNLAGSTRCDNDLWQRPQRVLGRLDNLPEWLLVAIFDPEGQGVDELLSVLTQSRLLYY